LIKTGLSARGYLTATSIMALEKVLVEVEGPQRRFPRDHEVYWVTVFGKPGDKQAWGWRLEGHHLSVRFDIVGGSMTASSPAFFGSNPAEVRQGPQKGLRVLGDEEDAARAARSARRLTALDGGPADRRAGRHSHDGEAGGGGVVTARHQDDRADQSAA
jgi:hypothetical protein